MLAYRAATYALPGCEQEARSILDLLNNYDGEFDWKDWLYRVYKNEQYAEQVLQPLSELESNAYSGDSDHPFWFYSITRFSPRDKLMVSL